MYDKTDNAASSEKETMIRNTATDYEKYVKIDLTQQLSPIEESIDNMLTRLEEFESMVAIVQQESGNVIGLTGTLSQVVDYKAQLEQLCNTIDILECMVIKVRHTVESLDDKVQQAEEQYSYLENNAIKNFFTPKIFKKVPETRNNVKEISFPTLNINEYFKQPGDT